LNLIIFVRFVSTLIRVTVILLVGIIGAAGA